MKIATEYIGICLDTRPKDLGERQSSWTDFSSLDPVSLYMNHANGMMNISHDFGDVCGIFDAVSMYSLKLQALVNKL